MESKIRKKTVQIKSALPIYGAAATFLVWGLITPIYKGWAILVGGVIAAAAYFGLSKVFPGRTETVEEEYITGDEELDKQLKICRSILARFRTAALNAKDEKVQALIQRIADSSDAVMAEVVEDKRDRSVAYTFFTYYMPTMDKLLGYYGAFTDAPEGSNRAVGAKRIEDCLDMVAEAFERFLDKLYKDEAASIKSDIQVLETMLRSEGLADKKEKPVKTTATATEMEQSIDQIESMLRLQVQSGASK